jgi:hypothetical protein
MAMTNAEKQARHRARRDAEVARLRGEIAALKAELARLRAALELEDSFVARSASFGDQVFRRVGERPYETKSGWKISRTIWESECAICGAPFRVEATKGTRPLRARTCPAHRLTKGECGRVGGLSSLEKRRRAFEEIKAKKLGSATR